MAASIAAAGITVSGPHEFGTTAARGKEPHIDGTGRALGAPHRHPDTTSVEAAPGPLTRWRFGACTFFV